LCYANVFALCKFVCAMQMCLRDANVFVRLIYHEMKVCHTLHEHGLQ